MRRTGIAVVAAMFAALLSMLVQSSAHADTLNAVTGAVRYTSGAPVSGFVTVYQNQAAPGDPADFELYDENNINGTLDFDLPNGSYEFEIFSFESDMSSWYKSTGTAVVDESGASAVNVAGNVTLPTTTLSTRKVTVSVKDGNGNALRNMDVGVSADPTELPYGDLSGTTSSNGTVVFPNVPADRALSFQGIDDGGNNYEISNVATLASGNASTVSLTMLRRGSISGVVTGTANAPLDLVDVDAYDTTTGDNVAGTVTDSHGDYSLTGLDAGTYNILFSDEEGEYVSQYLGGTDDPATATVVTVAADAAVTGKNVTLTKVAVTPPTGTDLTGVVSGGGSTLGNVLVRAFRNGVEKDETVTGRNGRYSFQDLTAGSYQVSYSRLSGASDELPFVDQWYLNSRASGDSTPVAVTPGATPTDKNVTLPQYGVVTGLVKADGSNTGITNPDVEAIDPDGNYVGGNDNYDGPVTPAGQYSLELPPGTYNLSIGGYDAPSETSFIYEYWDNSTTLAGAKQITVSSGASSTANASLAKDLQAVTAPKVSGVLRPGSTVSASTGTWNLMANNDYYYQWMRGSSAIGGATGPTYTLTSADVGSKITVKVTAWHDNLTGTATSAASTTVKRASSTTISGSSPKKKKAKLTVKVAVSGVSNPGGTVTIKRGSKVVASNVAVVSGVATITLSGQPTGKQHYTATYSGTGSVEASTSAAATVKVKKK
ncbi:MAG TPA: Ig-like domain repeat protein [Marmoricola sp.]|nr:Ig-like domain repeat protein [Marmoricola sp.]